MGMGAEVDRVILVDHGSPVPAVTAVRSRLAAMLGERLGPGLQLDQAVMERRLGVEYDFNGELLNKKLDDCASAGGAVSVVLAMMFISPGRHAGPGGDIETICAEAQTRNPGLQLGISPLIGEHPLLLDILKARLEAVR
jgi:sirohydrochlorin ferrochelatase